MALSVSEELKLMAHAEAGEFDALSEEVENMQGYIYRGHVLFDPTKKFGSLYGLRTQAVLAGWYSLINEQEEPLRGYHHSAFASLSADLDPSKSYAFRLDSGNQRKPDQPLQQWYYNIDAYDGAPAPRRTFRATVWMRSGTTHAVAPRAFIMHVKPKADRAGHSPRPARNSSGGASPDELYDPYALDPYALESIALGAPGEAAPAQSSPRGSKRKAAP